MTKRRVWGPEKSDAPIRAAGTFLQELRNLHPELIDELPPRLQAMLEDTIRKQALETLSLGARYWSECLRQRAEQDFVPAPYPADADLEAKISERTAVRNDAAAANDAQTLADNLFQLRRDAGLTQSQLSSLSRVTQSHISAIERVAFEPRVRTVMALARALKVQPGDLLPRINL